MQFKNVKLDVDSGEHIKFFEPDDYKNILNIKLDELVDNITANDKGERVIPLPTENVPESHSSIEQTTEYKDDNRGLIFEFAPSVFIRLEKK